MGRINGTYGTLEDSPIHYINQSVPQNELFAIYKMADVCLVTSVRDGMNLVSHEYVVAQDPDNNPEGSDIPLYTPVSPSPLGGKGSRSGSEGGSGGILPGEDVSSVGTEGGPGVLILSEFAGSAQSLSGAIRVNPWNTEELSTAIHTALTLSPMERSIRHTKLFRYVSTHTASYWASLFLTEFRDVILTKRSS